MAEIRKIKYSLIIILSLFSIQNGISAQGTSWLKTLFIYNFTKYIQWPNENEKGQFIIGVFGQSNIIQEMEEYYKERKVGKQDIFVKRITSIHKVADCHILFVPDNNIKRLKEIKPKLINTPLLIIADVKGSINKGADIAFNEKNGALGYSINQKQMENKGLKISSMLIKLSK